MIPLFMSMLALASAAALVAKVAVDLMKLAGLRRSKLYIPLAVLVGILCSAGLLDLVGDPWTRQKVVEAVLAGVLAGGSAAGVTKLQTMAEAAKRGNFGG